MLRALYKRLPEDRRVKGLGGLHGRNRLVARTVLHPLMPGDVELVDDRGVRFVVTDDPVDPQVVHDLTGPRRHMWFPDDFTEDVGLVLDVGGHHGHYIAAAAQHWTSSTIITVEPSAPAVGLIERHVSLNGLGARVEIVDAAISDREGEATLHHDPDGSWGSSLHEMGGDETETVRTTTLESILGARSPDVVKCNAEGGEFDLVPALFAAGHRPKLLTLMLHPEFGDSDALVEQVRANDYEIRQIGLSHRPAIDARPRG